MHGLMESGSISSLCKHRKALYMIIVGSEDGHKQMELDITPEWFIELTLGVDMEVKNLTSMLEDELIIW